MDVKILFEYAHKKDQIEMELIKIVKHFNFIVKIVVIIILVTFIIIKTNRFMMIGK